LSSRLCEAYAEAAISTEEGRLASDWREAQPAYNHVQLACYSHPSSTALWSNRRRASAAPVLSATSFLIASKRSIGAMPQLVQGKSCSTGIKRDARSIVAATSSGVSTRSLATSIAPSKHLLAVQKAKQVERHPGAGTFDRDLIDLAPREGREDRLVLPPFRPEA